MAGKVPAPAPVLLAGWIVPGGGHFLLGRKPQAVVFFFAVTLTYLAGMALADFGNVSLERHSYYFLAHVFNGGETLVAWLLTKGVVEDHVPTHFGIHTGEIGILYTAVASLLNLIVMMDAYGIAAGLKTEPENKAEENEGAEDKAEVPRAMMELLFLLPILAPIALVLGATRADSYSTIFAQGTRSFLKMLGAIIVLCIALQAVFYVVPLLF